MHQKTGAIAHFETLEDAENAGHTILLTPEQVKVLAPMERKARLAWARANMTTAQRKRKTKRKAARKARRANR